MALQIYSPLVGDGAFISGRVGRLQREVELTAGKLITYGSHDQPSEWQVLR